MSDTQAKGKAKSSKRKGFDYLRNSIVNFPAGARALYTFVFSVLHAYSSIVYPTTFRGEENLTAGEDGKGAVLVMNHVSMVEPVVFIVGLWRRGIHVRPLYKVDFDKIAPARWLFRRVGGIPVDRGSADLKALKACRDALRRGEYVLVFPEGTRVKNDEQSIELHGGFAMIAQMAGANVIPCAVVGAADPYKTRRTRRRMPKIAIGKPISFDELEATDRKGRISEMERVAMNEVYALRDELRNDYPGLW